MAPFAIVLMGDALFARGDDTYRRAFEPRCYGSAHGDTECIIHAVGQDFVVVAHRHLERIDDEGREGGVSRRKFALNERKFIVLPHTVRGSIFLRSELALALSAGAFCIW
jgi:hypothetical protein